MSALGQINPVQLEGAICCDDSHGQFYMCSYFVPVSCQATRTTCRTDLATVLEIVEWRPIWINTNEALLLVLIAFGLTYLLYLLTVLTYFTHFLTYLISYVLNFLSYFLTYFTYCALLTLLSYLLTFLLNCIVLTYFLTYLISYYLTLLT
jgi:hypothetical protein